MSKKDDTPLARAIQKVGNSQKLAEGLRIKPQAVSQWTQIPLGRVFDVERLTGIPHQELRPDFFGKKADVA